MPSDKQPICSKRPSASPKLPPVRSPDNNHKLPVADQPVRTTAIVTWKERAYFVYGFDETSAFGLKLGPRHSLRPLDSLLASEGRRFSADDLLASDPSAPSVLSLKLDLPRLSDARRSDALVVTGNVGIDFTNPLYQGSFNVVKYSSDSVAKVKDLVDSMAFLNPESQFLVVSFSRHDSLAKSGRPNLAELFPASDSKEDSLKTVHLLYALLNHYKRQSKNVVLLVDDAVSLFYRLFNLYHFYRAEVT